MNHTLERLEPTDIPRKEIDELDKLLSAPTRPALMGPGVEMELPEPLFDVLYKVVEAIKRGQTVVVLRQDESFTTQAAANFLKVSRPFLIKLLDRGEIPHFMAGSHRRIYFRDLIQYAENRTKARRAFLDEVTEDLSREGLYDRIEGE